MKIISFGLKDVLLILNVALVLLWFFCWIAIDGLSDDQIKILDWANWSVIIYGIVTAIFYFFTLGTFEEETDKTQSLAKTTIPIAVVVWLLYGSAHAWMIMKTNADHIITYYGLLLPFFILSFTEGLFREIMADNTSEFYLRNKRSQHSGYTAMIAVLSTIGLPNQNKIS